MRSLIPVLVLASLALAGEARAHLDLLYPTPRTTQLKSGPCGAGPNDPRGPTVATFKPGEKITVTWNEYVNHPGHYRIAIDMDGQDGFFDPKSFDDVSGGPGVIMDGIPDKQGGDYAQEITLPNEECDNCVLQVIQMMTDKAPYGDGNDLYYQCADIEIVGEAAGTTGEPGTTTGEPGTTGGPTTNDPSTTSDPSAGDVSSGGDPGETGAGETAGTGPLATGGDEPTTGVDEASTGAGTGGGGSTGAASDGGATDGGDKDSGCGCRGDAGAPGLLLFGLAPLLLRRGRRG